MPVDFGLFIFASPPRTATTWIKHAAVAAGLKGGGSVHEPHDRDWSRIRLSMVRRPDDWLRSYWVSIYPGQIQIDLVDGLRKTCSGTSTFDGFVRTYLQGGWRVLNMIDGYCADVVIRVEDLPWAFVEFLESLDVPRCLRERCLQIQPVNAARQEKLARWNPMLRARVLEAENELIDRYEY